MSVINLTIGDLFSDLCDGKILMNLLVIISGEMFGRPNRGVLRVQKMENVSRCLQFLATKVTFENIGAEDIVDGNPTLILGLIWTIILRFQIQEITIELDDQKEHPDKINAKDALLLWCQRKTNGYRGVKIDNFSTSWRNGLGFNALIHAHCPELVDYNTLNPNDHIGDDYDDEDCDNDDDVDCDDDYDNNYIGVEDEDTCDDYDGNLNNAFIIAEEKLGIKKLLDAEDVDVSRPDDKSIMTYVASYYHFFSRMKSQMTDSKRINNVLANLMDIKRDEDDYECLVSNLLEWINLKIFKLNNRTFPNSVEGVTKEMNDFTNYRLVEKPPKFVSMMMMMMMEAKLKSGQKKMYTPPEGKLIRDVESAWLRLERAEHDRELALREELIRQERLKQLAEKFEKKAILRESWLNDMTRIVSDQTFGNNTAQVEAALKKHEAITADRDRFITLSSIAQELYQENYHGRQPVKEREQQIITKWRHLLELLEKKKKVLHGFSEMLDLFRELESISQELRDMEFALQSEDHGRHLVGTQDLLQKHSLIEGQLNGLAERVKRLNQRSLPYKKSLHPEAQLLQQRIEPLNKEFENIQHLCQIRRAKLEECLRYYQFVQDSEEQETWLVEMSGLAQSQDVGKDLASCMMLMRRHEALEQEISARIPDSERIYKVGEQLILNNHPSKRDTEARVRRLKGLWNELKEIVKKRRLLLEDAAESHQNLLQRHIRLDGEIKSFEQDIYRLDQLAALMTKASSSSSAAAANSAASALKIPATSTKLTVPSQQVANGDYVGALNGGGVAVDGDEEEVLEETADVPYEYEKNLLGRLNLNKRFKKRFKICQ
ncbi:hypothetical protein HELRODRAFT_183634 [Helobdella robusta]|uniref:Calponin-homology (CH) domain-containing protein n=1 Tax=Helobdella robusta TaxID=6412 RepID=T1FJY9_HELRO|nr:hypothetical protein HELRODRAFT_183634 [Helobdella robusta]ESO10412.1 hypothetical protein HELRODRAFT_183634 [Helobdella robusta]